MGISVLYHKDRNVFVFNSKIKLVSKWHTVNHSQLIQRGGEAFVMLGSCGGYVVEVTRQLTHT